MHWTGKSILTDLDPTHPLGYGTFAQITGDKNTFVEKSDILGVDDGVMPEVGGSACGMCTIKDGDQVTLTIVTARKESL